MGRKAKESQCSPGVHPYLYIPYLVIVIVLVVQLIPQVIEFVQTAKDEEAVAVNLSEGDIAQIPETYAIAAGEVCVIPRILHSPPKKSQIVVTQDLAGVDIGHPLGVRGKNLQEVVY